MSKERVAFCIAFSFCALFGQNEKASWDSVKGIAYPELAPAFQSAYDKPVKLPLSSYGWEDGLHISRDGLNIYALYSPADLVSHTTNFSSVISSDSSPDLCNLFAGTKFIRNYAQFYGIDMVSNSFGCDSFLNIDIVYSHRNSIDEPFTSWQLSNIARPGLNEGGPMPLSGKNSASDLEIFLFTGDGDFWIIRNTGVNPSGINKAVRFPQPFNPVNKEFNADNPMVERLQDNSDTIVLIYEKYTDANNRTFMVAMSFDNGASWNNPVAITSISRNMGHIEHPHLYRDKSNQWWLYYSLDYSGIYRARQSIPNNWDSWVEPELIVTKGNAASIGEPSLTSDGDIAFLVGTYNGSLDSTDRYDTDPWYIKSKKSVQREICELSKTFSLSITPNPTYDYVNVHAGSRQIKRIDVVDLNGKIISTHKSSRIDISFLPSALYFLKIETGGGHIIKPVLKY
ncbi:MAG: T9SS type A sorting domain-containing protein [Fibrobacteres bacterium]|nr:T9SS type A sorting domain-containing protein [Fibrobacterota bacterium]